MQNYVLMICLYMYMKLHRLCSIQLDKLKECTNIIMIVTIMKIKLQNIQKSDSIDKLQNNTHVYSMYTYI